MEKIILFPFLLCLLAEAATAQSPCPDKVICVGTTATVTCVPACIDEVFGTGTWSSSNNTVATVSGGIVTGESAGTAVVTYAVHVSDGFSYFTSDVTVNPIPTASPSFDVPVCTSGNLQLRANDAGGNTYSWTGPSEFSSTDQNPLISDVTTTVNGIYTVAVTSPAGCVGTYTLDVTIGSGTPYTVSIEQTSPYTISGDNVHTYCPSSGFNLIAITDPTLPGTGVSYSWTDSSGVVSTESGYAPEFTLSGSAVVHVYTVTVAYNGCTASATDTIVVPPAGCSPCDHFSVNNYRTKYGYTPISSGDCADCADIQPFHTIISGNMADANVHDNGNYYIVNDATCNKTGFTNNNFFMNSGTKLYIEVDSVTTFSNCHLFGSKDCPWKGIHVKSSESGIGHVELNDNTLVEYTYHSTGTDAMLAGGVVLDGTSYYSSGMADIVKSDEAIFNSNRFGISIMNYSPSVSATGAGANLPFTIRNTVFGAKKLAMAYNASTAANNYPFKWPAVTALKTVVTAGEVPEFGLDTFTNETDPFNNIQINIINSGSNELVTGTSGTIPATYAYNYVQVGVNASDESYANTNLFGSVKYGVWIDSSNTSFFNNTFRDLQSTGVYATNSVNDLKIAGIKNDNTNNRFYNCNYGVYIHATVSTTQWDATIKNGIYKSKLSGGLTFGANAIKITPDISTYNQYTVDDNEITNYSTAILLQYTTATEKTLNSTASISGNVITGRTYDFDVADSAVNAIYVADPQQSSGDAQLGTVNIINNDITGTYFGIRAQSYFQALNINEDTIRIYRYAGTLESSAMQGITVTASPYAQQITRNSITASGHYLCGNHWGIVIQDIGNTTTRTDISCNVVRNINTGFRFTDTSYVNWTNNTMDRNRYGMMLNANGMIGEQGTECAPMDNRWINSGCSDCSCAAFDNWSTSGYHIYTYASNANNSVLHVRDSAEYLPNHNVNGGAGTAYSVGTSIDLATSCVDPLPDPAICSGEEESRGVGGNSVITETRVGNISVFPDPNDGNVTIKLSDIKEGTIKVRVVNAAGIQVFNRTEQLHDGRTLLNIEHIPTGIYIMQITDTNGRTAYKKMLVEK